MVRRGGGERPTAAPSLPVALLRAAVERELSRTSLRRAAQDIGLSPNALRNFVRGAEPRRATRVRLERWIATRPQPDRGPSLARFLDLLGALTPELPAAETRAIARHLTDDLVDAYRRMRLPPPRWVRELARHYHAQPTDAR